MLPAHDEHVLRLEVAVDQPLGVQRAERAAQLLDQRGRRGGGPGGVVDEPAAALPEEGVDPELTERARQSGILWRHLHEQRCLTLHGKDPARSLLLCMSNAAGGGPP